MPRNASGTYTLPAGNPVEAGTLIEASWANSTLEDMGNEITNSLSRTGEGGMLAPFRLADGTLGAPGVAWLNEPSTGFYRAGTGEMWGVVQGVQILQYTANGILIPSGKTLTAQGNLTVGGTLSITGAVTFTGNASVGGTLGVTGATTLSSTLAVTGAITATGGVNGNVTGNLTGNVTGNVSGNAGTVTNGVYTSGSYADPSWLTSLASSKLTGAVAIANGGTGQTTANAALNALLPSQTSQSGKYLKTDGTNAAWDQLDISTADITGTLGLANGGTGATTAAGARTNLGLVIGTDVPSPTGTGASGTWGISISGNANTVTNGVYTTGSYSDPSWLTSLAGSKITGAINNVTIGQSTAAAGSFTTLSASSSANLAVLTATGLTKLGASTGSESLRVSSTASAVNYVRVYGGATGSGVVLDAQGTDTNVDLTLAAKGAGNINLYTNPVLTGGTANGVAYLNGSKVLTTGSVLTFDGTNLSVPAEVYRTSDTSYLRFSGGNGAGTGANVLMFGSTHATNPNRLSLNSPNATATSYIDFNAAGAEGMRLTSTGLGIGTSSPGYKLDVNGAARVNNLLWFTPSSGLMAIGASGTNFNIYNGAGAETRLTVDSSGNLGLGVTPSAWSGLGVAFETTGGALLGQGTNNISLFQNTYYSAGFKYKTTNPASAYFQQAGAHQWYTAPSGTAGNAISFSQVMTLDASGNLGIGITSPTAKLHIYEPTAAASRIRVLANGGQQSALQLAGNGTTFGTTSFDLFQDGGSDAYVANRANASLQFWTNNTERARIDSSGNLGIGTSSPSTLRATIEGNGNQLRIRNTTTRYRSDYAVIADGSAEINVFDDSGGVYMPLRLAANTIAFQTGSGSVSERARIDSSGNLIQTVNTTAATLTINQTMTASIVNNTTLKLSVRGSDGVTRSVNLTLA